MTSTTIQQIRKAARMTNKAIAEALRVDERTFRRWQAGEIAITGPAEILLELLDRGEWTP